MTIALSDQDETLLRNLAKEKYDSTKGSMAKVISEGLHKVNDEKTRQAAINELARFIGKGFYMGKNLIRNRSELYDRK